MFLEIYIGGLAVILIAMTGLWLLSLIIEDASIVDIFWGTGFVIVGWYYFSQADGFDTRKWLIMVLLTIWGLRLTLHLAKRNIGKGEDFRYQKWREQFGQRWWWLSYWRVFVLQGVIMWIVSLPVLGAQINSQPAQLTLLDGVAMIIWGIGFIFEAGGDWQLMRFKANPSNKGKVLDTGLWRYTRHPNYFGDAVQWWAFYLFSLAGGVALTIISPLIMTYLLMRVSGVAMLEKTLKDTKPQYAEYIRRTSAFFPRPPRESV